MTGNSFKHIELFFPGGGSVEIKCYSLTLLGSTAVAHKDDNFNIPANLKIRIKKRTLNSVLLTPSEHWQPAPLFPGVGCKEQRGSYNTPVLKAGKGLGAHSTSLKTHSGPTVE